jgi:hypothetical protein
MSEEKPVTLADVGNVLCDTLLKSVNAVADLAAFVAKQYAEAGMPHGPSSEGLFLWIMSHEKQEKSNEEG